MRDPELWSRLKAYRFDGKGSAPFSVKLAQEQRWSEAYTAEVLEEYRRFLYLIQVSNTQITPSRAVDAAWHMHMTYTRAYWDDLCGTVVGKPIHHEPCAGDEDMPRYRAQFDETQLLYEAEFEAPPNPDVWGRAGGTGAAGPRGGGKVWVTAESLMVVAAVSCVLLYLMFDLHWAIYLAIMGTAFALGSVIEREHGKRRAREVDWIDDSIDLGVSGRGSRRGLDHGDNDSSGDDGGGCGGCGGD